MSFLGDKHLIPCRWVGCYPSTMQLTFSKEIIEELKIEQKTIFAIKKTKDGILLTPFVIGAKTESKNDE
jgi:hypothetical protein